MQKPKTVIGIAEDKALASFSTLVQGTIGDAEMSIAEITGRADADQRRVLTGARLFLQEQGRALRDEIEKNFTGYMKRAMQTMHTDLRTGLADISADNLTLIDDDVMTRQIEVDRLVLKLRDADPIKLGRINLMIAQMHGDNKVRERENPFRPYLLARAVHEALRAMLADELRFKVLFEHLGSAMVLNLPTYYAGIEQVFESRGIHARMTARPSELTRSERDRLAWRRAAEQMLEQAEPGAAGAAPLDNPQHALQARMLPKLQRLQQRQAGGGGGGGGSSDGGGVDLSAFPTITGLPDEAPPMGLQQLVHNVFNHPHARMPGHDVYTPPTHSPQSRVALNLQLRQMQLAEAAQGTVAARPEPLELREQIADGNANPGDRLTVDLVALLFEFIVHDEKLPSALRKQLARMQLPFLRAAVADPTMLHEPSHPARRLLDRIGTVAAGVNPHAPGYEQIEQNITRVVDGVLERFDDDVAVFADSERELDEALLPLLRGGDDAHGRYIDAIEESEAGSALLEASNIVLHEMLVPLVLEARLYDFLALTWVRVLSHPACSPANGALLPELIWSAQEKLTPEDRTGLMKLLPALVPRVREGLSLIGLDEEASKAALDQLVAIHMDVLGNKVPPSARPMSIEELRSYFARFGPERDRALDRVDTDAPPGRAELEQALAARNLQATVVTEPARIEPDEAHDAWLAWARPGAAFELLVHETYVPVRLCAVSRNASAYVFAIPGQAAPTIYLRAALLAAMQAGVLRSLEYAPLFDRAVESLMAGAESLTPAPAP